MSQAEHQQATSPVSAPRREQGDYFEVCGRVVGIVLALDESTEPIVASAGESSKEPIARPLQLFEDVPAVCHVVDAFCRAQLNEVFVVSAESIANDVSWVVQTTKRKKNSSPVQVVAIDGGVLLKRTREAANFMMFDLPFGVLELARGLAGTVIDGYDYVVIMNADNIDVTPDHIYELCLDAAEHPKTEAMASSVDGVRRPPYLFAREFLEGLESRGFTSADADGRDVPVVIVRNHPLDD